MTDLLSRVDRTRVWMTRLYTLLQGIGPLPPLTREGYEAAARAQEEDKDDWGIRVARAHYRRIEAWLEEQCRIPALGAPPLRERPGERFAVSRMTARCCQNSSQCGFKRIREFADLDKTSPQAQVKPYADNTDHSRDTPDKIIYDVIDGFNCLKHVK